MYVDKSNGTIERKPVTVPQLAEMKQKGEKIAMLTSYDSSMTYQMEKAVRIKDTLFYLNT